MVSFPGKLYCFRERETADDKYQFSSRKIQAMHLLLADALVDLLPVTRAGSVSVSVITKTSNTITRIS